MVINNTKDRLTLGCGGISLTFHEPDSDKEIKLIAYDEKGKSTPMKVVYYISEEERQALINFLIDSK